MKVRVMVRTRLSRTEVLKAIRLMEAEQEGIREGEEVCWTLEMLAAQMEETPYRVKSAVAWLIYQGRVTTSGEELKTNQLSGRVYPVTLYRSRSEKSPDYAGLMMALMGIKQ